MNAVKHSTCKSYSALKTADFGGKKIKIYFTQFLRQSHCIQHVIGLLTKFFQKILHCQMVICVL